MKLLGLKTIRKTFGFTMRDLAKKLNISANAINIWENGGGEVPDSRIEELSNFFGIDKYLLLKEEHNSKDLMLIEVARFKYMLNEYNENSKEDVIDVFNDDIINQYKTENQKLKNELDNLKLNIKKLIE